MELVAVESVDDDASTGPNSSTARSVDLARRFVEQIMAEAVVTARQREPDASDPVVDWQAIWA